MPSLKFSSPGQMPGHHRLGRSLGALESSVLARLVGLLEVMAVKYVEDGF